MSDSLDTLAIMTVMSNVGVRYECTYLWYFRDKGLKRSKHWLGWDPDEITDLSTKEKLRRSKVCEWLDDYFRRNPAPKKPQWEGRGLGHLLRDLRIDVEFTIVVNVSNFPGDFDGISSWGVARMIRMNIFRNKGFLLILVLLSLVYGGVHLATWNFAFASKTEHLLWKIACIDIMATVPIGVPCLLGFDFLILGIGMLARSIFRSATIEEVDVFRQPLLLAILYTFSVAYALSRIYLVAESFIGLRHVPIGVYAAVPWVQAIPHV